MLQYVLLCVLLWVALFFYNTATATKLVKDAKFTIVGALANLRSRFYLRHYGGNFVSLQHDNGRRYSVVTLRKFGTPVYGSRSNF